MFGFRKSTVFLLALLFCGLTLVASKACQVSIDQTIQSSWNTDGVVYTLVNVALTNKGTSNVLGVTLKINDEFNDIWEMTPTGADNLYVLPQWRSTSPIQPGQAHDWGYIIKSSNVAPITVHTVDCDAEIPPPVNQPTQLPTEAPTQPATQAPTQPATQAPTQPATQAPTQPATRAPTQPATRAPTQPATQAPTHPATQAPTHPATQAPTRPATQAPTHPATQAPTQAPTQSATVAPTRPATQAPTTRPSRPHDPCDVDDSSSNEPTRRPTRPPTDGPTLQPTLPPTDAPTERPTRPPPTQRPTNAPTTRPTRPPPTQGPTDPPCDVDDSSSTEPTRRPTRPPPTQSPTDAPTTRPTRPPSQRPSNPPTNRPTSSPTNAPGVGRLCPAGSVWSPTPGTTWQWQLTGTVDQSLDVQMYDIDLFDNTAATIASLHSAGRAVVCYFSTQYEDWRPDADDFTDDVLGHDLDDWPGEKYVDIRSDVVRDIMTARLDLAVQKGCDGVEPDNVDEYTNTNGLGITAADQLDFNKFIADEAHARGLSVGLKNDLDQVKQLESYFDWALDEQCNQYDECDSLSPFADADKAVFGVEYKGSVGNFCPEMKDMGFSWLLKDMDLDAKVTQCCSSTGGCSDAPYTCVDPNSKRSFKVDENATKDENFAKSAKVATEPALSSASSVAVSFLALAAAVALVF